MNALKELWNNKNHPIGRIDLTVFFINLFLLICHVILMVVYLIIGYKFMIFINIISLLVYMTQINRCFKNLKAYVFLSFFEILIHMILAILSFGCLVSFQNWSFALIVAYFLPVYRESNSNNRIQTFIFTFILIFTYFFIPILIQNFKMPIPIVLSNIMNSVLFALNNLFSFIAITMFVIFYINSSKRKEFELTRKADYDELTDLYNRYSIMQISKELDESSTDSNRYNIAIIDIDFFKNVNDKYGHNSGDIVLKEIAKILKNYSDDFVPARWGGEEFIILSKNDVSFKDFKDLMEELRVKISKHVFKIEDEKEINLSVSIGISKRKKTQSFNESLKVADDNLYKAKELGRNKVIF